MLSGNQFNIPYCLIHFWDNRTLFTYLLHPEQRRTIMINPRLVSWDNKNTSLQTIDVSAFCGPNQTREFDLSGDIGIRWNGPKDNLVLNHFFGSDSYKLQMAILALDGHDLCTIDQQQLRSFFSRIRSFSR